MSDPAQSIERVSIAGSLRFAIAALLGLGLFFVVIMAMIRVSSAVGEFKSLHSGFFAVLILAILSLAVVVPVASQLTRCVWQITSTGIDERIVPLFPVLPFGLYRSRMISWGQVVGYGVAVVSVQRKDRRCFKVMTSVKPDISFFRRGKYANDPKFDHFVKQFESRARFARPDLEPFGLV